MSRFNDYLENPAKFHDKIQSNFRQQEKRMKQYLNNNFRILKLISQRTRCYREVHGLRKNKFCLNLPNFVCHLLENSHLVNVYTSPIAFSNYWKHSWRHSYECWQGTSAILVQCRTQLQNVVLWVSFSILWIMQNHRELGPMIRAGVKLQPCCFELKIVLSFVIVCL